MKVEILIAIISVFCAIVGTWLAVRREKQLGAKEQAAFIREQVAKEVNLLRDLEHLKRNHAQTSEAFLALEDRVERMERKLKIE